MSQITVQHHEDTVIIEEGAETRFARFLRLGQDVALLALVFLFPLFYLPGLQDGVELPKQILLLALTTLAGVFWLGRVFLSRSIVLRSTFLFFPVVLYIIGIGVAAILSVDRYTSLFGGVMGEYASVATLIGFFLFLFFATSSEHDVGFIRRALVAFFVATALLFLCVLLRMFGVTMSWLPGGAFWNSVGSVYALGIFGVIATLLASGALLFDRVHHAVIMGGRSGIILRVFAVVTGVLALVYLLLLDWWVGWTVLLVGAGLLLGFVFIYAHTFRNLGRLLLPLLALVLAVLFLAIRTPVSVNFPIEISPSQQAGWDIAKDTLREHPAFGSGPATYAMQYVKHRPESLAQTQLWGFRFDRAASFGLTLLPTTGIAGGLLWLLMIGVIVGFVIRSFLRERDATAWLLTVALFFPWCAAVVARLLYSSNMTLEYLFWFLTTLLMIAIARRLSVFTFHASPRALLGTSLGAVVFAVLMVILLLLGVSRYVAWASFGNALRENATGNLAGTRESLVRAASYDPKTDVFARNLAQVRIFEAARAESVDELRAELNAAVAAARVAVNVSPANAQNWSMLGAIYREMAPVVGGAGELGLQAFEKARELEPPSPVYPTELGRLRLVLADRAKQEAAAEDRTVRRQAEERLAEHLSEAVRNFEEAVALKQDYGPAHFYLAFALERQGKLADAIKKMESVVQIAPRDVGAMFQLGLLYLENRDASRAEQQFVRALQLSPNFANAHWYLASIYESRGETAKAITEVEAVLATNPDNQAVKDRLARLRSGGAPTPGLPEPVAEGNRFPQ